MKQPKFQNKKSYVIYEIVKRLYFLILIAYVPMLGIATLYGRLRPSGGFIDFGFWFSLLLLFLWTLLPVLLFAVIGQLVRIVLCYVTKGNTAMLFETSAFHEKIRRVKNVMTAIIVTVSGLLVLLVPYSTIRYDDGGTVKHDALLYTVMEWNRTKDWYGEPVTETSQETCIYFFPQNLLSYDELWELKH